MAVRNQQSGITPTSLQVSRKENALHALMTPPERPVVTSGADMYGRARSSISPIELFTLCEQCVTKKC